MKAADQEKKERDLEKRKAEEERIQEVYKDKKKQGQTIKAAKDEAIKAAKDKETERQKAKKVSRVFRTS
jgi:hypothetical protein